MQRISIGQTRRKQGEQGAVPRRMWAEAEDGKPGPVNSGDVLPKGTTTGVPTAAATCIGPLSFVSSTRQSFSRTQSSRSVVFPARLITCSLPVSDDALVCFRIPVAISAPNDSSFGPPKINHRHLVRFWIIAA